MRVFDPGHVYLLEQLDGDEHEVLHFVKRQGEAYPGNVGHHPGTTTQEVLRVLIDRTKYVQAQLPCAANVHLLANLRHSIWVLERRAAERHGRELQCSWHEIELMPTCARCGHLECEGRCR